MIRPSLLLEHSPPAGLPTLLMDNSTPEPKSPKRISKRKTRKFKPLKKKRSSPKKKRTSKKRSNVRKKKQRTVYDLLEPNTSDDEPKRVYPKHVYPKPKSGQTVRSVGAVPIIDLTHSTPDTDLDTVSD